MKKKKKRRKVTWVEGSGYNDDLRNEKLGLGKTAMRTLVG